MTEPDLNIPLLITKAQNLVHGGKINFASRGESPVQDITFDDGSVYELSVVMKFKRGPCDYELHNHQVEEIGKCKKCDGTTIQTGEELSLKK